MPPVAVRFHVYLSLALVHRGHLLSRLVRSDLLLAPLVAIRAVAFLSSTLLVRLGPPLTGLLRVGLLVAPVAVCVGVVLLSVFVRPRHLLGRLVRIRLVALPLVAPVRRGRHPADLLPVLVVLGRVVFSPVVLLLVLGPDARSFL